MTVRPILLLGTPSLFEPSGPVLSGTHATVAHPIAQDLLDTMADFRRRHGWGRAIAAPQIGKNRRVVAMKVDRPVILVNPVLTDPSPETVEIWEDCMSFPDLMVRIRNPVALTVTYEDLEGRRWRARLEGDYTHLLIHEIEHLEGKLATMRPVGPQGLALRATQPPKDLTWHGRFQPEPDPS